MATRERFVASLTALLSHIDSGGIQDTALPGTAAAEAIRLLKNGLSVSAFACFEHFVRGRIDELLRAVSSDPARPPFDGLPGGLQLAATKGVIDALRFRLGQKNEGLDTAGVVSLAQAHADLIVSSKTTSYSFSEYSFGWAASNVGAGTLQEFLSSCNAGHLYNEIGGLLREVGFDYAAAGLAEGSALRLGRIAGWRHEAAHNSQLSIDIELLRTRITSYLAVAFAFDALASLAVRDLKAGFVALPSARSDRTTLPIFSLRPDGSKFSLRNQLGVEVASFYAINQCRDDLPELPLPENGVVAVRDAQNYVVDWFFS